MPETALDRQARQALTGGIGHLLRGQSRDGLWRDYDLAPGSSEAWSTAWVGWCLACFQRLRGVEVALRRAAHAVVRQSRPEGWGYNSGTQTDGDSTAWACRFLQRAGVGLGEAAVRCLTRHLDPADRVHTFLDVTQGTWSDPHDDVTAIVGLALHECRAPRQTVERVRNSILASRTPEGIWRSFWWATDAYATAWSVAFLSQSGRLPGEVKGSVAHWVRHQNPRAGPLEVSLLLLLAFQLGSPAEAKAEELVIQLLDDSRGEEGWPGTPLLLVPPRHPGDAASPIGPHADERGYMTTALTCVALGAWLARERGSAPHPERTVKWLATSSG